MQYLWEGYWKECDCCFALYQHVQILTTARALQAASRRTQHWTDVVFKDFWHSQLCKSWVIYRQLEASEDGGCVCGWLEAGAYDAWLDAMSDSEPEGSIHLKFHSYALVM